ncbi:efflux RND transporter periplasmic adaptor subunit [Bordetella sp. FB-8]|uniref:efflux RND transporter periplasmic adaptor subunit n=1 Tax=Bordetella sp. FB-8 TaxID=1159870 RepID=UPI0003822D51|nr:efflux RND transporter periplasmic adaptor subunit [Bordetella sp. FB-8]
MKKSSLILRVLALALSLSMGLTACGKKQASAQAGAKPEVWVVTLKPQAVNLTTELPGRTSAYREAQVRPQVNGIVQKRLFIEGGEVKANQQLYQIDPALYQAQYDSSKAALAKAIATQRSAAALAQRYKPLVQSHAVSRQAYDDAVAAAQQAAADVLSAKAAVETAHVNLVYTKVLSPISGIIGRSSVTEGALVTANQADPIATVQQIDPMYVDVAQSSMQLLRLKQALADGRIKSSNGKQAEVRLTLEDGTPYPLPGKMEFSEVTVDPTTGSVIVRARFPNPDHMLLPGMFVRATLSDGVAPQGLLVPQRGVTRDQRGEPTVLMLTPENKVELRVIKTDRAIGDQWLVTGGLKAGDRVIVEGVQRVHPGVVVNPQEWKPSAPVQVEIQGQVQGQAAQQAK